MLPGAGFIRQPLGPLLAENEEGFFVSSRDSAMREKGALNEAARRRMPRPPAMGKDRPS
jgi:hypothetical protein